MLIEAGIPNVKTLRKLEPIDAYRRFTLEGAPSRTSPMP
jgi:hypothetical protein